MKTHFLQLISLVLITSSLAAPNSIVKIDDTKALQKLLKGRNNVLVLFAKDAASVKPLMGTLNQAADELAGVGTIASVDCDSSNKETKKLCKNKIEPGSTYSLHHFHKAEFNKLYDRQLTLKSILAFMRDPTGEPMWEEDPTAKDVVHLSDQNFEQFIAKGKPTLVMFYAPWCGHCKNFKPEFAAAATSLKGKKKAYLAAIDTNSMSGRMTGLKYNITGFPTIKYFEKGKVVFEYGGERTSAGVIEWLNNPSPPAPPPPPEPQWNELQGTNVTHLEDSTFDDFVKNNSHGLIMFYAPWCGHCKAAKPEYETAAGELSTLGLEKPAVFAAIDGTVHPKKKDEFNVQGFPSIFYFSNGSVQYKYEQGRTKSDFLDFIRDPKPPPPPPPPETPWSEVKSGVLHLTDANFHSQLKRKPHVLVMFYAPWCGHCKHFKPLYQDAADDIKERFPYKAALAAVDSTIHKQVAKEFTIEGYPTIKYFRKGKYMFDYTGERTKEAVVQFIEEKVSTKEDL